MLRGWLGASGAIRMLLCLAFPTLCTVAAPQETPLLKRAVKVADVSDWALPWSYPDESQPDWLTYRWLTNRRVLFLFDHENHFDLHVLDVPTGQQHPLNRLSQLWGTEHRELEISPDGRWALWSSSHDCNRYVAAQLDGSHKTAFPAGADRDHNSVPGEWSFPLWLPDSQRWIEVAVALRSEKVSGATVHFLHRPAKCEPLLVPPVDRLALVPGIFPGGRMIVWEGIKGDEAVRFFIKGIGSHPVKTSFYKVAFPKPWRFDSAEFSQDGRRVAWILTAPGAGDQKDPSQLDSYAGWEHVSLWTSDLNGRHLEQIGSMRCPPRQDRDPNRWRRKLKLRPQQLHWLPSGKQLSFVYKNGLYTVWLTKQR
jgi:hypothetical protein